MTSLATPDPTGVLQRALEHESPHVRTRARIILMTLDGASTAETAAAVGMTERTVQKWLNAWRDEGIAIFPEDIRGVLPVPAGPGAGSAPFAPTLRLEMEHRAAPGVERQDSMTEAGRKIMLYDLEQMLLHEAMARSGEDDEGVHKMRVATRRLRSAYRVFGDYLGSAYFAGIPKKLKRTATALGRVRDLDVFLAKTQVYLESTLGGDPEPLMPLLEIVQARRDKARRQLIDWLDDKRFQKLIERFYELLQYPTKTAADLLDDRVPPAAYRVDQVVPRLIYTRLEAVRRYDAVLEGADAAMLHSLRIEFKRLRYGLEFFNEVLGPTVKKVIREVKQMQDHLGDLNDAETAIGLIRAAQADIPKALRAGTVAYRKARRAEAEALIAAFPAQWAGFNRREIREALALAVAEL